MNPNDKLKAALWAEHKKLPANPGLAGSQMPVLGAFLTAALGRTKLSVADLARELHMETTLVSGILDGLLPESELDDETLVDFARVLELEPNLLRAMLMRKVDRASDVSKQER